MIGHILSSEGCCLITRLVDTKRGLLTLRFATNESQAKADGIFFKSHLHGLHSIHTPLMMRASTCLQLPTSNILLSYR